MMSERIQSERSRALDPASRPVVEQLDGGPDVDSHGAVPLEQSLAKQVHPARSRVVRGVLLAAGFISVGLGVLGIVLPVVPTTPFLLLAAACFAHSSERFYVWLLSNRFFGHYVRDWREKRGLSIAMKAWITFVLAMTMGASIVLAVPILAVKLLLAGIGLGISAYIWQLPTKKRGGDS